jgi:hypothetical protein
MRHTFDQEHSMILADVTLTDILWSTLVFFFFFMIIMIFIQIIGDLFRNRDMSGGMKALWVILLILFTPLAMLIYLVVYGGGMAERAQAAQIKAQQDFNAYAASVGAAGPTEQIAQAKDLLDHGAITQAEFDAIKAKALA